MSETGKRMQKVRENVYHILEDHPETRNDDRLLLLRYWNEIDEIEYDKMFPVAFATKATSPESITRARRSIQQTGLFLPTLEEVRRTRRQLQEEMREHYANQG